MNDTTDLSPPVIGISATPRTLDLAFARVEAHTVLSAFVEAVAAAGGLPVLLPPLDPARAATALTAVDGLVLTGGEDLDPTTYGGPPNGRAPDSRRDRYELALAREAHRTAVPVLGVCRGMHVLNVALGGTLTAHIDGHLGLDIRHRLDVLPSSILGALVGTTVDTGSLHHQAPNRIADGLRAVATAADGTVEALETVDGRPQLGVQWHPEMEPGRTSAALFGWLVRNARRARWN